MSEELKRDELKIKRRVSYAKLKNLTEGIKVDPNNPEAVIERISEYLKGAGLRGLVQLGIRMGEKRNHWVIELDEKTCKVIKEKIRNPDLEIFTRIETGLKIVNGSISPMEAIAKGQMRIRGNIELGRLLYKKLASTEGKIFPCL